MKVNMVEATRSRFAGSFKRVLILGGAALLMTVPASAARFGFRGGFGLGYGPGFGPWGWYGPGYYYAPYSMVIHPNAGQIKFDTKLKDAEVYINGAYAGTVRDLKSVWMRQGNYNLEIRAPGRESFTTRIFVLNGKTMHLHPELRLLPAPVAPPKS